jgi:uncharacterized protein YndB with AHSA1/START domain
MSKRSARSIADVSRGAVLARVEIAAPPERVWKAITEDVASWWGSDEHYRTTKHTVDLRPGGAYRSDGIGADGSAFHVEGEVIELDPPRKYVTTWKASWSPGPATTVTYTLEPIAAGTRVTVHHAGFTSEQACEDHGNGWERVLDWLAGFAAPKRQHFMCRLIPPRPTFAVDATADERALMKTHSDYWRAKLADGGVIAFGVVGASEGPYGLGLVAADDEAALRAFEADDPVIKSGRGFRYEHAPMLTLVT